MEDDPLLQSHPTDSDQVLVPEPEPFLTFNSSSELLFEEQLTIYCSLVALVKAEYPFDDTLQDNAAQFLKNLAKECHHKENADQLVTILDPSSAGSPFGFIESILTLLSSPHLTLMEGTLLVLSHTVFNSSFAVKRQLVNSDFIPKVLTIVQPSTQPIAGNEDRIDYLIRILLPLAHLAFPYHLIKLGITAAVDKYHHREMIHQKVVIPSSHFVTFLISNRYLLHGLLLDSFMDLLYALLYISPFHHPTLEHVLASPIAMAFSSCVSLLEHNNPLCDILKDIHESMKLWEVHGPEVVKSGKVMLKALFSEGFLDTLEQLLESDRRGKWGNHIVSDCRCDMQMLGSNVECTEDDDEEDSDDNAASLEWPHTRFCGLFCDGTNAPIAGADEQTLCTPSNRPKMICSFGFVDLNAAVFNGHLVNRPLSKQFLASLNGTL
ncbi:hypothetical protein BLNAU_3871 [Blattamonas nauphoetae]|uniref:Uncharacterized protein n=1 Tax=Blattamonas nauphoetae TaxID=2049346 RepID=A0ABQ9YBP4_9EUKA|nr:hypothetical protein BLNAU_3871 [Blattamonas nauphoetae]